MRKVVDEVIVISVGPSSNINYIQDTIDSIIFYTKSSYVIILVDDSGKEIGSKILTKYPLLKIIENQKNMGKRGKLYISLSRAFRFAFENYDFKVLLNIDDDTLMIGPSIEKDAILYFRKYPHVGQLGSYKIDCNMEKRDYTYTKKLLIRDTNWKNLFSKPKYCIFLKKFLRKSLDNGYELGEHCLGAAYFLSKECIGELIEHNLLQREELGSSNLSSDHIFSLLIRSVGFEIGDFATGNLPIGIRHKGLPCSPDELIRRKKKITHSVRFWDIMNEDQIRDYFEKIRMD